MEDDFKDYGRYSFFREYPDEPDFPDSMESMDGMQLAMGARGQSAEQREKFEGQTMVDYIGSEAKETAQVVGGGMAEMGAATVKGLGQAFFGLPGDIVMIGRGVEAIINRGGDESKVQAFLRGMQEKTILPTTDDIKKWIDENIVTVGKGDNPMETIGEVLAPGGYVKGAKVVGKGITTTAKEAAPIVGEMFEKYAARTGLTNYIADPSKIYFGYAGSDVKIKPLPTLERAEKKLSSGAIDEQTYINEAQKATAQLRANLEAKKTPTDKKRGADEVRRRILTAKTQGDIGDDTAEFALWLLGKNPQIGDNLGLRIKGSKNGGQAGNYSSGERIATLFKGEDNPGTAVHEILHHTERMMPVEIQNGVLDEWNKSYLSALSKADDKTRPYLAKMLDAINGSTGAKEIVMEGFKKGILKYDQHYQLVNPSEFWAVNATRLMQSRYDAGSWIGKAKVWVQEMSEKAKGVFGLPSDSPILRGLKEVTGGKGKFKSTEMMGQEEPVLRARIRGMEKEITAQGRKRVAKTSAALGIASQMQGEEQ
jgi:hypothetical protein